MARINASVDEYETRLAAYTAPDNAANLDAIMAKFDDELAKRNAAQREATDPSPAASPKSSALEMIPPSTQPSPALVLSSPTLPHTAPTYAGVVISTMGGSPPSSSQTAPPSTTIDLVTITPSPMACRSRPRRCPGRHHQPRAPNHSNGAIPSHPQSILGGTLQPTSTPMPTSARVTMICCSPSPNTVTVSPSTRPITIRCTGDLMSSGGRNDYFRDCGEHPRKRPQWKPHARRVCWRHGPRAPSLGPLCGRGHRPRAPILPKAF